MRFPEKFQMLRKDASMTQTDLARFLEVSQQTIAKWENGTTTPDIDMVTKIAKRFGVTTDYLLGVSRRRNSSFENFGDVMRIFRDLESAGVLSHRHDGPDGISQVVFTITRHEISTLYEEYDRMVNLLFENRITQKMFTSWYEGEMLRLSSLPLPQVISLENISTQPQPAESGDPDGEHN